MLLAFELLAQQVLETPFKGTCLNTRATRVGYGYVEREGSFPIRVEEQHYTYH